MENVIKILAGVAGAVSSYLWGGWSMGLTTLVVFMSIDFLTGISAAGREGTLSSKVGFFQIPLRKVMIFFVVAVAHLSGEFASEQWNIGNGVLFRDAAIAFYVANEALSIIENIGRMGIPIPPKVKEMIEVLKEKGDHNQ